MEDCYDLVSSQSVRETGLGVQATTRDMDNIMWYLPHELLVSNMPSSMLGQTLPDKHTYYTQTKTRDEK